MSCPLPPLRPWHGACGIQSGRRVRPLGGARDRAPRLTTTTFAFLQILENDDPSVGRAEALHRTMLGFSLDTGPTLARHWPATSPILARYWAPLPVPGEGRR